MRSNVPSSSGCVAGTAASGTPVVSMPGRSKMPLTVRGATPSSRVAGSARFEIERDTVADRHVDAVGEIAVDEELVGVGRERTGRRASTSEPSWYENSTGVRGGPSAEGLERLQFIARA